MTRPSGERESALYLAELGLNDCQIGRVLGIPRRTVQGWRRPRYRNSVREPYQGTEDCPRCHHAKLEERRYVYLLGLYLGDGWIGERPRGVFDLQITCCDAYPGLIAECFEAMAAMRPDGPERIGFSQTLGVITVASQWKHWPCLFPQHGRGPKHERRIVLEDWQKGLVSAYPDALVRGLIHSDGWRGRNQGRGANGKLYFYTRYEFSNNSADIRAIFRDACDALGIECRRSNWNVLSIAKRGSVAKMDLIVGPKT